MEHVDISIVGWPHLALHCIAMTRGAGARLGSHKAAASLAVKLFD